VAASHAHGWLLTGRFRVQGEPRREGIAC
jgi:hypothetical protein